MRAAQRQHALLPRRLTHDHVLRELRNHCRRSVHPVLGSRSRAAVSLWLRLSIAIAAGRGAVQRGLTNLYATLVHASPLTSA